MIAGFGLRPASGKMERKVERSVGMKPEGNAAEPQTELVHRDPEDIAERDEREVSGVEPAWATGRRG